MALGLELLGVPLGLTLIEHSLPTMTIQRTGDIHELGVLGLALALAPLLTLGAMLLSKRGRADAFAVFLERNPTKHTTIQFGDIEPSSLEFARYYRQLVEEALSPNTQRRLILIVDNLDRLESQAALSVWRTLQAFIEANADLDSDLSSRIWAIVTYAPDAAKRWRDATADDTTTRTFLDKTVQVVLDVPSPALSTWRSYLGGVLREALPQHEEADFEAVYQVYASRVGAERHEPTPRDLRLFVNQIAVLHMQFGHEFPLAHLALYAVLQRQNSSIPEELLSGGTPTFDELSLLGPDITDSIAAIWYGTDTATARQLLYRPPILEALANAEVSRLGGLINAPHAAGVMMFTIVDVISESVRDKSMRRLASVATTICSARLLESEHWELHEKARVTNAFVGAVMRLDRWEPAEEIVTGLPNVLRIIGDAKVAQRLFEAFRTNAANLLAAPDRARDLVNSFVVRTALELYGVMAEQNAVPVSSPKLLLLGNLSDIRVPASIVVNASTPGLRELFEARLDDNTLSSLGGTISSSALRDADVDALQLAVPGTMESLAGKELVEAIAVRIKQAALADEVRPLMRTWVLLIKHNKAARQASNNFVHRGGFASHAAEHIASGRVEVGAWVLAAYLFALANGALLSESQVMGRLRQLIHVASEKPEKPGELIAALRRALRRMAVFDEVLLGLERVTDNTSVWRQLQTALSRYDLSHIAERDIVGSAGAS